MPALLRSALRLEHQGYNDEIVAGWCLSFCVVQGERRNAARDFCV